MRKNKNKQAVIRRPKSQWIMAGTQVFFNTKPILLKEKEPVPWAYLVPIKKTKLLFRQECRRDNRAALLGGFHPHIKNICPGGICKTEINKTEINKTETNKSETNKTETNKTEINKNEIAQEYPHSGGRLGDAAQSASKMIDLC